MALTERMLLYRRRYDIFTDSMILFIVARDDKFAEVGYAIGTQFPREYAAEALTRGGRRALKMLYEGVFCDLRLHLFSTPSKWRRHAGESGLLIGASHLRTIMDFQDFGGVANVDTTSPAGASDPTVS